MTNIKITRNCKNGEHHFIPQTTFTDGRETLHTAFVCQFCLYYVDSKTWENHQESFKSDHGYTAKDIIQESMQMIDDNISPATSQQQRDAAKWVNEVINSSIDDKNIATTIYNLAKKNPKKPKGKKRGPKPKIQGTIEGIN